MGFPRGFVEGAPPGSGKIHIIWMTRAEEYHDQVRNSSFCATAAIKYIFLYDPFEFLDDGDMAR